MLNLGLGLESGFGQQQLVLKAGSRVLQAGGTQVAAEGLVEE